MRRLPHGLLAMALTAGPAAAQAPAAGEAAPAKQLTAQEQAAVYFEQGRAFFKAKDYRAAAEQFQAAYNLDPVPILLYNMARAAEEMGDPEKAIVHYESYLKRIGPEAEDRDEVQRRIRVMEKTIAAARRARIRIAGLPPNARITVDGQPIELEDGLVRAEPGKRVLVIAPVDGKPWTKKLGLSTGEYVELVFGEVEAPPPPEGMSGLAIAGWSTLGAGAVLAVLGGVFYAEGLAAADDRDAAIDLLRVTSDSETQRVLVGDKDEATDRYDSAGTASAVFFGLGAAALLGGGAMLALEYGLFDSSEPSTGASVVPLPGGVGFFGRF